MTFDPNGGTVSSTSKTGTVDAKIGSLPTPTKAYYTFNGWFTAKSGGTEITANYVQKTDDNITVYAQWTAKPYTMTFDPNGGNCSTTSKTGTVDAKIGTLPTPTRELYSSTGWYTEKTGGTRITADYVHETDANITVYAHWEPLPYTISFNGNGNADFPATVPSPSTRIYYADTAVGDLPVPTRAYHTFNGWFTEATSGTQITSTYKHQSTATLQVYAHWTPYTFKLNLNPNGGDCSTSAMTCSVGVAIGALPTPTREHYTFNGWYTAASGGSNVTAWDAYDTDNTQTIYAQWTAKSYTYTINYVSTNGTALGSSTATKSYGTTNTITPPNYAGYNTPSAQSITWDATSKTVTFTYTPITQASSQFLTSGTWFYNNSGKSVVEFSVSGEWQNRTANSVQVRVVWTQSINSGAFGFRQVFYCSFWNGGNNVGNTGIVQIAPASKWYFTSSTGPWHTGSVTAYSDWVTVSLNTTEPTSVVVACDWWTDHSSQPSVRGSWSDKPISIPAY